MNYTDQLNNCNSEIEFKAIWNSDKFNWEEDTWYLANYGSDYFNIWWDKDKWKWKDGSYSLMEYCQEYKHIWIERYVIEKLKRNC